MAAIQCCSRTTANCGARGAWDEDQTARRADSEGMQPPVIRKLRLPADDSAEAGGKLRLMVDDRRGVETHDRRANPRGGRRNGDQKKPWYMRRRLWLAGASLIFVGWRRLRRGTGASPLDR